MRIQAAGHTSNATHRARLLRNIAVAASNALARALSPRGGLWVIRPKGHAEISEAEVRAAARGAGLVDVKVASFSPTHTADKFVIPAAARGPRVR